MNDRPRWMSVVAAAWLAFRDLFVSDARDVEVWLGFEVKGTAALLPHGSHKDELSFYLTEGS